MDLEDTKDILSKLGFVIESITPPDPEHFGNWVMFATRPPVALRAINDRGVVHRDLAEITAFKSGAKESDWFNWDVVARAFGIKDDTFWTVSHVSPIVLSNELVSFARSFEIIESAFRADYWKSTLDRLHKIEADKRRRFMEGRRAFVGT
jgi:hypothetical protein